ncbi:thylakoid membrane protein ThyD [Lyngbya confervoides]|uniref:TIGR01777 family oxidoreductase n=1 Tax=Lyngbya confervoides BDU141951 TaxID=1574623 RepID=A0ABD4T5T1_9CYAN|nr:TIGR01777 family oxidoreductase [Lyngbya confervoides]MCM1984001.1 TIGR01777 family oxidoreductase [Lyngbya confervoides BDU141951]
MKVAITGATGFVGRRLVERLIQSGHQAVVFVRNAGKARKLFDKYDSSELEIVTYQPKQSGDWQPLLAACDGVVNLAGEPLFDERWNANAKQEILDSRVLGTHKLVEAIAQSEAKPQVMVSASAVGYYGTSETTLFDETSSPGEDFLAQVCQAWEASAHPVEALGVRLAIVRIGIVLGPKGGALARMLPPFELFGGGPIGSGRQWVPWVHRDDLVSLILQILTTPSMAGVFNATAPHPQRMSDFSKTLGNVLHRPSWLPVPGFALELLLGEAAQVVLQGQHVQPKRTQEAGFSFQYPDLKGALTQILK